MKSSRVVNKYNFCQFITCHKNRIIEDNAKKPEDNFISITIVQSILQNSFKFLLNKKGG